MRTNHRVSRLTIAAMSGLVLPSLLIVAAIPGGAVHAESARPSAKATTYTVENGDTLYTIARQLGVTLVDLLAANDLEANSLILPGATLTVPRAATGSAKATPATSAAPVSGSTKSKATVSTPTKQLTYTVQSNDGFYTIAYRHGVSLTALLDANDLTLDDVVHPGTVLVIPAGGRAPATATTVAPATPATTTPAPKPATNPATAAAAATTYTVQSNDGLYTIAYRHGVSLTALLDANDLTLDNVVHPGTVLVIPAGGRPPQPVAATTSAPANTANVVAVAAPSASIANTGGGAAATTASSSRIDVVIAFARAQLGKPYRFAAAGPDAFDCSGLTTAAYRQVGVYLPQQSLMQSARGTAVDWRTEPIRPGDLVFVNRSGTDFIGHVGIAISSTMWIHAPREGDVVRIGIIPKADKIQAVRRYVAS